MSVFPCTLQLAFQHVASAARTTKMVQNVAEGEIENTEDPQFKADLTAAKDRVTQSIAPMVTSARSAITQPGDAAAHETFCSNADNVRHAHTHTRTLSHTQHTCVHVHVPLTGVCSW